MTLFGEPHGTHSEAYVMIPPEELKDGLLMLRAAGLTYDLLHEDLQRYSSQSYNKHFKSSHNSFSKCVKFLIATARNTSITKYRRHNKKCLVQ